MLRQQNLNTLEEEIDLNYWGEVVKESVVLRWSFLRVKPLVHPLLTAHFLPLILELNVFLTPKSFTCPGEFKAISLLR